MKTIILKPLLTSHQRILVIGFSVLFLAIGGLYSTLGLFYLLGLLKPDTSLQFGDWLAALLLPLSILLIIVALVRQGLILESGQIKEAIFLFKKPIKSKPIELKGYSDIGILSANMSQKYAFGASPNPDHAYGYKEYRVVILNKHHTKKLNLVALKSAEEAESLVKDIQLYVDLKFGPYRPAAAARRGKKDRLLKLANPIVI